MNGLAPADSLKVEFCLGRICAVESQSSQMEDMGRRPLGKESRGEAATGT